MGTFYSFDVKRNMMVFIYTNAYILVRYFDYERINKLDTRLIHSVVLSIHMSFLFVTYHQVFACTLPAPFCKR